MNKLNLGCGSDIRGDHHNVDIRDGHGVDQQLDLSETPWPWDDNEWEWVLMDNVFEHLPVESRRSVLGELHRVTAHHGVVVMRLPVPESGVGWDVTHHPVPSWKLFEHPAVRDDWLVKSVRGTKVGPGRFVPERVARFATRFWLFRGVSEVEVRAQPL